MKPLKTTQLLLLQTLILATFGALTPNAFSGETPTWALEITQPQTDAQGWSILTPSSDSRIIYVSNEGNDATGQPYSLSSDEVGNDPYNPKSSIKPYATLSAALTSTRNGHPDWVLVRRGDSFNGGITLSKGGRSPTERLVITTYGNSNSRPIFQLHSGNSWGGNISGNASNVAILGIELYNVGRDPNSSTFVGYENTKSSSKGIGILGSDSITNLLIEDCKITYFGENLSLVSTVKYNENIVIRRNIIAFAYNSEMHAQGMYSTHAHKMLLEENIFYHNGWIIQNPNADQRDTKDGQATQFNHNTYFTEANQVVFRDNLFLSPSSIGNKFTSNTKTQTDTIKSYKILLDGNVYYRGEIAASIGGNDDMDNGHRWDDIYVMNNVVSNTGESRPTGRKIGWGVELSDVKHGVVKNNLFTNIGNETVNNTYAISVVGHIHDIEITGNKIDNIYGAGAVRVSDITGVLDGQTRGQLQFKDNDIQNIDTSPISWLAKHDNIITTSSNNQFYSSLPENDWWDRNAGGPETVWRKAYGDETSIADNIPHCGNNRSLITYKDELGYTTLSYEEFVVNHLLKQSKLNWHAELKPQTIRSYFNSGQCDIRDKTNEETVLDFCNRCAKTSSSRVTFP